MLYVRGFWFSTLLRMNSFYIKNESTIQPLSLSIHAGEILHTLCVDFWLLQVGLNHYITHIITWNNIIASPKIIQNVSKLINNVS